MPKKYVLTALLVGIFFSISTLKINLWSLTTDLDPKSMRSQDAWTFIPLEPLHTLQRGDQQDCVSLADEKVKISSCSSTGEIILWQSNSEWKVKEVLTSDLNNDGKTELVLLVWRPFKPWPIDVFLPSGGRISAFHDNQNMSSHLILIGWDGNRYREFWAGSALADPISNIRSISIDDGHTLELIAIEGRYNHVDGGGNITSWVWNGFGFDLQKRISGNFSNYGLIKSDSTVWVISN
jgi:hypothetical protein